MNTSILTELNDEKLIQFIKQYHVVDDYDDYLTDTKKVNWKIYLPFFIKNKETTLDMGIVQKLHLKNYDEPGIEQWSTEEELQSASFKFMKIFIIDLKALRDNPEILKEEIKSGEKSFINECIQNIKKIIDSKTIFNQNIGSCNEEDCQGHYCGDIIYHVIGWAGDYVPGNSLRKTSVRWKP